MRKLVIFACALALSGCAWLGWGEDTETAAQSETAPVAETPMEEAPAVQVEQTAPETKSAKKTKASKSSKGAKTEAQIKAELDAMGKKLAAQSARTLVPNRSKPEYKQAGGEWIASFISVDPNSVTTEMKPGNAGNYVGVIRYQEKFMECRGATKQAALNGACKQVKTRNLSELIRYDGKEWQD